MSLTRNCCPCRYDGDRLSTFYPTLHPVIDLAISALIGRFAVAEAAAKASAAAFDCCALM